MYSLLVLAALAQPAPEAATPGGARPEQALAKIDGKGKLTITLVSPACPGPGGPETTVTVYEKKGTEKVAVQVKVKVASVVLTTAELPAKYVEAYTVEGTAITGDNLAEMLTKERTVLVAMDGKKVDPFHLQLYKEGTIVLVPPANTLVPGFGGYVGAYGGSVVPVSPPPPPMPLEKPKPDREPRREP